MRIIISPAKKMRVDTDTFSDMTLPALLAYDGIQYTYMAPAVFEDG
jgi:hypothetical protein